MTPEEIRARIEELTGSPKPAERHSVRIDLADGLRIGLVRLGVGYELRITYPGSGSTRLDRIWGRRVRALVRDHPYSAIEEGAVRIDVGDPRADGMTVRGSVTLHAEEVTGIGGMERWTSTR